MTQDILCNRLCVLLAFQAMISNGKLGKKDAAQRTVALAKQMKDFCDLHVAQAFPQISRSFVDDKEASKIDDAIAVYINELKTKESTARPQDKEALIRLYDRLQHRKSRRMQAPFYLTAKEEKLADLVLRYLDEEIEAADAETAQ